jgi:hypothetical protein
MHAWERTVSCHSHCQCSINSSFKMLCLSPKVIMNNLFLSEGTMKGKILIQIFICRHHESWHAHNTFFSGGVPRQTTSGTQWPRKNAPNVFFSKSLTCLWQRIHHILGGNYACDVCPHQVLVEEGLQHVLVAINVICRLAGSTRQIDKVEYALMSE